MESYSEREYANEALDAIAAAEVGTYVPPEGTPRTRLTLVEWLLAMVAGAVTLAAAWWLMSGAWWRFLLGIAIVIGYVMVVSRVEQRHTNVRPKLRIPRHVLWATMQQTWPLLLAVGLLTPFLVGFVNTTPGFAWLFVAAAAYLALVLAFMLFFNWLRLRRRNAS